MHTPMILARDALDFIVVNDTTRHAVAAFMLPSDALACVQTLLSKPGDSRYAIENADGSPVSTALCDRVEALHLAKQAGTLAAPRLFTIFEATAIADRETFTFATVYVAGCTPEDATARYRARTRADAAWIANDGGKDLAVVRAANDAVEMTWDALRAWETGQTAPQFEAGQQRPAPVTEIRL